MKKIIVIPYLILFLLFTACNQRLQYEYFEPSGLDSVVSIPSQAQKNVAIFSWDGCELQVRSRVFEEGQIVIFLTAILPQGSRARFSGDRAVLWVSECQKDFVLFWSEWTLVDGYGNFEEIAFDAPLKSRSFAETPKREGIEDMGRYEAILKLPAEYSELREFTLVLPAPVGHPPLRVRFIRKAADYKIFMPYV